MTQYSVELSADAQYQINSIVRYIAMELGNVSAAKRFIDDVEKAMKNVQSNPFSHMIDHILRHLTVFRKGSFSSARIISCFTLFLKIALK